MDFVIVTERLGWPRRWWQDFSQSQLVYDDRPDEPSATCHITPAGGGDSLCGHPEEALIAIPGDVEWTDLHPTMRCDGPGGCAERAGLPGEEPDGRVYRFDWSREVIEPFWRRKRRAADRDPS